jgi:hypothetical protein
MPKPEEVCESVQKAEAKNLLSYREATKALERVPKAEKSVKMKRKYTLC